MKLFQEVYVCYMSSKFLLNTWCLRVASSVETFLPCIPESADCYHSKAVIEQKDIRNLI